MIRERIQKELDRVIIGQKGNRDTPGEQREKGVQVYKRSCFLQPCACG